MKGFAFVLLCALVAVQARYTAVQQSTRTAAALGENPWLVHLRIAIGTSGLLRTCAGSLIDSSWVLTTATCLDDVRYIWVRYGVVNVINPSLVTENSQVRYHPDWDKETGANNLALISINRVVQSTDNIYPVALADSETEVSSSATYCAFGADDSGKPGEQLSCYQVGVEVSDDGSLAVSSDEVETTAFDVGAPLVSNGVQVGILTAAGDDDSIGTFAATGDYLSWIEEETGLSFSPEAAPDVDPESVKVVN